MGGMGRGVGGFGKGWVFLGIGFTYFGLALLGPIRMGQVFFRSGRVAFAFLKREFRGNRAVCLLSGGSSLAGGWVWLGFVWCGMGFGKRRLINLSFCHFVRFVLTHFLCHVSVGGVLGSQFSNLI